MAYFNKTLDSNNLITVLDLPEELHNKRVRVIVLSEDTEEKPNYALKVGLLDLPDLPDSFFDPLPEEELQAWGL